MRWRTANRRKRAAPDKRADHAFEKWADAKFGPLLSLNPVLTPVRGSIPRIKPVAVPLDLICKRCGFVKAHCRKGSDLCSICEYVDA